MITQECRMAVLYMIILERKMAVLYMITLEHIDVSALLHDNR